MERREREEKEMEGTLISLLRCLGLFFGWGMLASFLGGYLD